MRRDNGQAIDTRDYRRRVLVLARDRLDQMVTALLDTLFFLPGYTSNYTSSDIADIRSGVRYTAECFLGALSDERPLSEQELVTLTIIGGRRAHLPREVLVAGVTAACDAGFDFLLDVAREVPAPASVALSAVQWWRTALATLRENATDALRTGQANEQERRPRTQADERLWLVDRLLLGLWDDAHQLEREATRLGCDLAPPIALLVVVAAGGTSLEGLRAATTGLAKLLPGVIEGPARPMPSRPHVVLLASRRTQAHQALSAGAIDEPARAACIHALCPDPSPSLAALPVVYRRAVRDLPLPARVQLRPGVVSADDLAYYRLLTRGHPEEVADFAERFVGALLEDKLAGQLVKTLEALHRCDGVPSAAAALGVHENTVRSRIRKATELTGCDLGIPVEAERVFAGLRLRFAIQPDALAENEGEPRPPED